MIAEISEKELVESIKESLQQSDVYKYWESLNEVIEDEDNSRNWR